MPGVLTPVTQSECLVSGGRQERFCHIRGRGAVAALLAAFVWKQVEISSAVSEIERLGGSIDVPDVVLGPAKATFDIPGCTAILDDRDFHRLLPHLQSLPRLKYLNLCRTKLTPEGLHGIGSLTTLTRLDLPARCISETSITEIAGLAGLESLYVCGDLSPDLAERLRRALPAARVHFRSLPIRPRPKRLLKSGEALVLGTQLGGETGQV